jgi:hypothetical protein
MALVVYNPNSKTTHERDDYKSIREKLDMLMSEDREKPYLGLSN